MISLAVDVAITVNPVQHPDLIISKLFNDQVTLWHNPKTITKLSNVPIIYDPSLPQPQIILKKLKRMNFPMTRLITSSSLDVIANLTANGCGVGIIPKRIVLSTYPDTLKPVENAPVCYDEVCIIFRPENRNVLAIQTIVNHIKKIATA